MAWDDDHAQQRFRDFIAEVERELGGAHGWRTSVANRLGISLPHLSRILAGKRRVGAATMQRAAEEWGFAMEYFASEAGSYRSFLEPNEADEFPIPPGWRVDLKEARRQAAVLPGLAEAAYLHLAPPVIQLSPPGRDEHGTRDAQLALARAVLSLPLVKHAMAIAELSEPGGDESTATEERIAQHAAALKDDVLALLKALAPHLPDRA